MLILLGYVLTAALWFWIGWCVRGSRERLNRSPGLAVAETRAAVNGRNALPRRTGDGQRTFGPIVPPDQCVGGDQTYDPLPGVR